MRFVVRSLCLAMLCFFTFSCNPNGRKHDMGTTSFLKIDEQRLDTSIYYLLNEIPDSVSDNVVWLKELYRQNNYGCLWVTENQIKKADTLLNFIRKSDVHSLPQSYFFSDSLRYVYHRVKKDRFSYYELAKMDILLSMAYVNYSAALNFGVVVPKKDLKNYYFKTNLPDSAFVDRLLYHTHNLTFFLNALQRQDKAYIALRQEAEFWKRYLNDSLPVIPLLKNKAFLKMGSKSEVVKSIVRRLKATGDLSAGIPDSTTVMSPEIYTAITNFQNKAGLYVNGQVGNVTIRLLNMPAVYWLEKVNINMERMRWKTDAGFKNKYVRVNVADMTLKAVRNDSVILRSKVCVGKAPTNKTPFLISKISEIILNPVWSVPSSIIVKEISQTAQRDTAYFKRNKIKVYKKGELVDPAKVDWAKVTKTNQPYRMVQDAGDINSLGKIKFNFANPFGVYLHDTNSKRAFLRYNRAVSHGCVRVEKPLELTFFCLPYFDPGSKTTQVKKNILSDQVRHAIRLPVLTEDGKSLLAKDSLDLKNHKLWLSAPVTVLVDYFTCFVDDKQEVVFRPDIYEMDSLVRVVLQAKTKPVCLFR